MWAQLLTRFAKSLGGKKTHEAAAWLFNKGYKNVYKKQIPPGENYVGLSSGFQKAVKNQEKKIVETVGQKESGQIAREGKTRSQTEFPERATEEATKQSKIRKKRLRAVLRGEIEPKDPIDQRSLDYFNAGFSEGSSSYAKAQEKFAKEFGRGSIKKLKSDEDFLEAFSHRRAEAQMIAQGLLDDFTPANQLLTKYGKQGWGNLVGERQGLTDLAFGDDLYPFLSENLGLSKSQILGGMGHQYPLRHLARLIAGSGKPNMSVMRAIRMMNNPQNIKPELNFMNIGKHGIENYLYQKPLASASDLGPLSKVMKHGQVSSKFYGPTGTREQIGMPGREIDPKQLLDYLDIIQKDNPFGFTAAGNKRFLPIRKYIEALLEGKQKWNYQAGGLVGLGSRILKKLAKKLSRQELKMMMGQ